MIVNVVNFLICIFFSILLNIIFFRIFRKKLFIIEFLLFSISLIIFIYFSKINDFYEILYYLLFILVSCLTYSFITIMPIEGSPSLDLLTEIYNKKKIKKKSLYKFFSKKKFFEIRFKSLIKADYLEHKKNLVKYNKKNLFIFNLFLFLEKIKNNNIKNG